MPRKKRLHQPAARPRVHRLLGLIAVACLAAGALAACGGGSGSAGATSGSLTVATGGVPTSLDPCAGAGGSDFPFLDLIYAPLVFAQPSTGKFLPGLAQSWAFSGPDNLTFTMKLKPGVTFQDGTPVNAQAVVESIDHCVGEKLNTIATMKSIAAVNSETVRIELTAPTSSLPGILASRIGYIVSPAAIKKYGQFIGSHPVGAGPYQLQSYVPSTSMQLTAFKGYRDVGDPAPKNATISIQFIQDPNSVVQALTSGSVDYAFGLSGAQVAAIQKDPNLTYHVNNKALAVTALFINPRLKPMNNVDVRLALNYAINRKALAEAVSHGVSTTPAFGPYPPGSPYYDPAMADPWPYNPAKAKALLAAAGYPNGLTITALAINQDPFSTDAIIVADQLSAVGVKLKVTQGPGVQVNAEFNQSNAAQLYSTEWCCTVTPFLTYQLIMSPESSFTGDHPAAMKAPVDDMNAAYTNSQLAAAIDKADQVEIAQAPWIPLFFSPGVDAYAKGVSGEDQASSLNDEPDLNYLSVAS